MRNPLQREQCMACGLMRKSGGHFLGDDRFYEEQYESYYARPGMEHYDRARYDAMAEWMASALGNFEPRSMLDIGCGAGWSYVRRGCALQSARRLKAWNPPPANADKARKLGFSVYSTRLGTSEKLWKKYNLVYAFNVLQHAVDPIGLLRDVVRHLSPGGQMVLILPDAGEPSHEILWCDHNYSFRATDIPRLAAQSGLKLACWQA